MYYLHKICVISHQIQVTHLLLKRILKVWIDKVFAVLFVFAEAHTFSQQKVYKNFLHSNPYSSKSMPEIFKDFLALEEGEFSYEHTKFITNIQIQNNHFLRYMIHDLKSN